MQKKLTFNIMIDWWNSLDLMMKLLWAITLSASLVFIIQTIMTFLGADSGGDFDMDVDADASVMDADMGTGSNLLTFRNLINFLLGFGWTAVLMHDKIASVPLLMIVSVIVGVILVILVMWMFKWLSGMQQAGNINLYKSAIGCIGKVYLSIPKQRQGSGKVQVSINNSVREYSAVTDGEALPTGTEIRIVDVISADTVLVEEINSVII